MTAHRYWRLVVTDVQSPSNYCQIIAMELHTAIGGPDITTPATVVKASSNYPGNTPDHLVARPPVGTVVWTTAQPDVSPDRPCWVMFDLGSPKDIVEYTMQIRVQDNTRAPKRFAFQSSDDGITWPNFIQTVGDQINWVSEKRTFAVQNMEIAGSAKLDTGDRAALVRVYNWNSPYQLCATLIPSPDGSWKAVIPSSIAAALVVVDGPAGYQPVAHGPITAV